jgi:hypothetical protein
MENRIVNVLRYDEGQRLEALNDLVNVFEDALHGLMLVHHPVEPETPHRAPTEGGQEKAPERVAQGVAEATFQRLEPEFCGIRIVVPLGHLDQVWTD